MTDKRISQAMDCLAGIMTSKSKFADEATAAYSGLLNYAMQRRAESSDELSSLAAKYLARDDEDWAFIDPEDVKKLAASVLSQANVD